MALSDCLADEGYAVLEASNVLEAIAALGRQEIDALITDVDMPGALNGFDLAKLVASYDARPAVLVTSGGHIASEACDARACLWRNPTGLTSWRSLRIECRQRHVGHPLGCGESFLLELEEERSHLSPTARYGSNHRAVAAVRVREARSERIERLLRVCLWRLV
ncbi:response regulator [Pararhizobium qamdonense]|uniref:response regulator n=1 Tax=Pararhizobium qamdonense TaxID=3031126 RepID=UPI002E21DA91